MALGALRAAVATGLLGGALALLMALVGMVERFSQRDLVAGVLSLSDALLLLTAVAVGRIAKARGAGEARAGAGAAAACGALAAALAALPLCALVLVGQAVNLRAVLLNASPELYRLLTFERPVAAGLALLLLGGAVAGAAGGLMGALPPRAERAVVAGVGAVVLTGLFQELLRGILRGLYLPEQLLGLLFAPRALSPVGGAVALVLGAAAPSLLRSYAGAVQRRAARLSPQARRALRAAGLVVLALVLVWLPQVLGTFLAWVVVMIGLYALMGLGLNLEVGWAGLLDLGFVAFFAIGAYTVALLTSLEKWFKLSFWEALPVAMVVSVLAGALLGVPVLGMRGDYVAIATLGFGEIVRLLVLSEWLRPITGGSQGIGRIPGPSIGGTQFTQPQQYYYLVVAACAFFLLVAGRLRYSRLGRAWMAIREDEDVAEAMGINLVVTKLLAYALGAGFAGFSGAVFAAMVGSVYPHSFHILVSINVLALIIVGGMGSIPGVFAGATVLVGLPELLREFDEFRLLWYGALLIVMMLKRPEGFLPEAVVRRELAAAGAAAVAAPGAVPAAGGAARGASPLGGGAAG